MTCCSCILSNVEVNTMTTAYKLFWLYRWRCWDKNVGVIENFDSLIRVVVLFQMQTQTYYIHSHTHTYMSTNIERRSHSRNRIGEKVQWSAFGHILLNEAAATTRRRQTLNSQHLTLYTLITNRMYELNSQKCEYQPSHVAVVIASKQASKQQRDAVCDTSFIPLFTERSHTYTQRVREKPHHWRSERSSTDTHTHTYASTETSSEQVNFRARTRWIDREIIVQRSIYTCNERARQIVNWGCVKWQNNKMT